MGALSQKIMDLDGNIEVLKEIEKKYTQNALFVKSTIGLKILINFFNRIFIIT